MAIRRRSPSERGQLDLFRALPGDFEVDPLGETVWRLG